MPSILFVCVHNACRSQIAEALFRTVASDAWLIESAGSSPSFQVDPKAVEILRRHQLTMKSSKPKGFSTLPPLEWDHVIFLDSGILPEVPAKKFTQWDISDPQDGPMSLYEALFEDLTTRIQKLIQEKERSRS